MLVDATVWNQLIQGLGLLATQSTSTTQRGSLFKHAPDLPFQSLISRDTQYFCHAGQFLINASKTLDYPMNFPKYCVIVCRIRHKIQVAFS